MPFTNLVATLALRVWAGGDARLAAAALNNASDDDLEAAGLTCRDVRPVSYTHLTLPTILLV